MDSNTAQPAADFVAAPAAEASAAKPADPMLAILALTSRLKTCEDVIADLPSAIRQHDDELAAIVDAKINEAVLDAIRNHPEVIAKALEPFAGRAFRKGVSQTTVAVAMAPVRAVVISWKWLTTKKPKAPATAPQVAPDMGAAVPA